MSRKVLGYSILVAALLLSVAGVAYAHWTKVITVDGYVISGSVDWCWSSILVNEGTHGDLTGDIWPVLDPPPGGSGYGYWYSETWKNIASVRSEIDQQDCKLAYFYIDRAYPSYFVNVGLHAIVTGTVPVKVNNMELWQIPYEGAPQDEWELVNPSINDDYSMLDWDDDGEPDVEIGFPEGYIGAQLDPGIERELSFWLHVEEDVAWTHYQEDVRPTYCFAIRLVCVNYNEYPIDVQPIS